LGKLDAVRQLISKENHWYIAQRRYERIK